MRTFLLQAKRDFVDAGIPKGYMLQVISGALSSAAESIGNGMRGMFGENGLFGKGGLFGIGSFASCFGGVE